MGPADALLLGDLLGDLNDLGFDVQPFGERAFVVHGFPPGLRRDGRPFAVEEMLDAFRAFDGVADLDRRDRVARSLARTYAIPAGRRLEEPEMRELIDALFGCPTPFASPGGDLTS